MRIGEILAQLGSVLAAFMFMKAVLEQYFPHQVRSSIEKHTQKLYTYLSPYIQIRFNEFTGERFMRSEAYSSIDTYLSSNSSAQARRLKADIVKTCSQSFSLSMDDNEVAADVFEGVKVWWSSGKHVSKSQTFSFQPVNDDKRFYNLKFHKKHRNLVIDKYLNHVMIEGNSIKVKTRQRRLFTNNGSSWSHVPFEHPATFQTLAMDPDKKRDIVDDLLTFSKSKDFYSRIGRAWKSGYLLYGPPGTGKSTMIAAMANLLGYDIYDLELTAVKDNTKLKKLLIATSSKAIVVIEDIDCSSDQTGQRISKKRGDRKELEENDNPLHKMVKEETDQSKNSKITLSGLLNFIDGLWSACGGERIIVFTTNFVERLDPPLIRRGHMDKHIEMSYCGFEGFKILAKNYLDLEWHDLFPRIESLLGEIKMTPADVAENLMPRNIPGDAEKCLRNLILALEGSAEKDDR